MAFTADQTRLSTQSNARNGAIVRFIWHHQAGTSDDAAIQMMVSGSKQVSATWTVDNTAPVGGGLRDYARITSVVPEDRRPWTTASSLDDGALTVECANSSGPPDYGISDASLRACARLAAYAKAAYGVPLQRATAANGWRGHMGHSDAPDTYATACPLHLDVDAIIALASGEALGNSGLQPTPEEDDMSNYLKPFIASIVGHARANDPGGAIYLVNPNESTYTWLSPSLLGYLSSKGLERLDNQGADIVGGFRYIGPGDFELVKVAA